MNFTLFHNIAATAEESLKALVEQVNTVREQVLIVAPTIQLTKREIFGFSPYQLTLVDSFSELPNHAPVNPTLAVVAPHSANTPVLL